MDRKGAVDQPPASIVIPSSAFHDGPFQPETASATSTPLKAMQEERDIPPPVKAVQEERDIPPPVKAVQDQRASQPADVGAPQGLLLRAGLLALFSAPFGFLTYGFFPDVDASVLTTSLLVLIGVGTLFVYIGVTSGAPRPKRQPSTVVVPTKSTPPSIYDTEIMQVNATVPMEEGGDEEEPAGNWWNLQQDNDPLASTSLLVSTTAQTVEVQPPEESITVGQPSDGNLPATVFLLSVVGLPLMVLALVTEGALVTVLFCWTGFNILMFALAGQANRALGFKEKKASGIEVVVTLAIICLVIIFSL